MTTRLLTVLSLLLIGLLAAPAHAQEDGLNLPTELYTLLRDGSIERFGLGAAGVAEVTPEASAPAVDFGLSPDGVWIAYRTDAGALEVYNMVTPETRSIDPEAGYPPYRGRGESIAWSPDGAALAYTRDGGLRVTFFDGGQSDVPVSPLLGLMWSPDGKYLAAEAENDVWWVYRRDGVQMVLHAALPSSRGAAWVSPSLLMIAPAEGGLAVMDVANANQQTLLADASKTYQKPARRVDGSVVVFGRAPSDTDISETAAYLHDVQTSVAGVSVTQASAVSVELANLRWAPGGRLLVALQSGVLVLVDPVSAQGFSLPLTEVASYAWGAVRLPSIPALPLSAPVYFLADDGSGAQQVWALPADGAPAAPLTDHPSSVTGYDLAPDGETLAYTADDGLWLSSPDQDAPTPLAEGDDLSAPMFDATGAALVYQAGAEIRLLELADPSAARTLLTDYTEPRFVAGAGGLLVRLSDDDLGLYGLETGEVRRLGAFDLAKPLPDGRIIAVGRVTRDRGAGLYLIDLAQPEPTRLYALPDGFVITDFTPLATGPVRVIVSRADGLPAPLRVFDVTESGVVGIPALPYLKQARLSRDGGTLAGYASGAGNLAVYNVALAAETIPPVPAPVTAFGFAPFR